MLSKYSYRAARTDGTVGTPYSDGETPTLETVSLDNTGTLLESHSTVAAVDREISFPFGDRSNLGFPNPIIQNTGASLEIDFNKEIESGVTKALEGMQEHFFFPSHDEEDILDWDVAIINPPPRPSGTIRVKLKYRGRSKPIPINNSWE